jgi:hypothetical protein
MKGNGSAPAEQPPGAAEFRAGTRVAAVRGILFAPAARAPRPALGATDDDGEGA